MTSNHVVPELEREPRALCPHARRAAATRGRRGMTPTAADVYGLALAHEAPPRLRARRPDGTAIALALHRWLGC